MEGSVMRSRAASVRGFTLTELVTALAILGILTMAGAPALAGMLARSHDAAAENAFVASLMHARETAILRRTQVLVCPSPDGRQCRRGDDWQHGWMVALDDDRDGRPDGGTPPRGTRVITTVGRPQIAFRPNGGAGGSNATFTICHAGDGRGRSVVVANSGRVRAGAPEPQRLRECLALAGTG